jgi:hypothetical protein
MKSALVIYYTIVVVVVVVGIALVGAVSIGSNMNLVPVAYATDKQYCTHIQDYDEDGTPTIGSSCSGSMKDCKNDPEGIDKCVKDDKFVYP